VQIEGYNVRGVEGIEYKVSVQGSWDIVTARLGEGQVTADCGQVWGCLEGFIWCSVKV